MLVKFIYIYWGLIITFQNGIVLDFHGKYNSVATINAVPTIDPHSSDWYSFFKRTINIILFQDRVVVAAAVFSPCCWYRSSSWLAFQASGYSSQSATAVITPATKANTFSKSSFVRPSIVKATIAPSGSARPEKLASQNANHGRSGFAAIQGTVVCLRKVIKRNARKQAVSKEHTIIGASPFLLHQSIQKLTTNCNALWNIVNENSNRNSYAQFR